MGVEHLLRDINDPSVSTLANQVRVLICMHVRMHSLAYSYQCQDQAQRFYQFINLVISHLPHHPMTPPHQIKHKLVALSGLKEKLGEMNVYLTQVLEGKLPVNNQVNTIIYQYTCVYIPGKYTY